MLHRGAAFAVSSAFTVGPRPEGVKQPRRWRRRGPVKITAPIERFYVQELGVSEGAASALSASTSATTRLANANE